MGPRSRRFLPIVAERRPEPRRATYVRFVCFELVQGMRARLGLFQAIDLALESEHLTAWNKTEMNEVVGWFNEHLNTPPKATREGALSWFKSDAVEYIRRMHGLKAVLEDCGIQVEVLTTKDPGKILYEDDHQVTARPLGNRF